VAAVAVAAKVSPEVVNEIRAVIFKYPDAFIEECVPVQHMGDDKTPAGKVVKWNYNYDQRRIARYRRKCEREGRPMRAAAGKARQRGISTKTCTRDWVQCWAQNYRKSILVAHREDRATAFLDKLRFANEQLPEWLKPKLRHDSDVKISFADYLSFMWILSVYDARSIDMARGETPHSIHGTEWTRWRNFYSTLTEVQSACHAAADTSILLESTLIGRGSEQHDFWLKCKKGKMPYEALWLAWQDDPATHLDCHLWSEAERHQRMAEVAEYEPELIKRGIRFNLSIGQVWQTYLWLKNTKLGKWEKFIEDYPLNDDEAWQAIGYLYFEDNQLLQLGELLPEIKFIAYQMTINELERGFSSFGKLSDNSALDHDSEEPKIIIWAPPRRGHEYIIGAISTPGNHGSAPSASYVIDKANGEMVAAFHGTIKPHQHGQILNSIGKIYNEAVIAPDANTAEGLATLAELSRLRYPRLYLWKHLDDIGHKTTDKLGWWTNRKTTSLSLNLLARVLEQAATGGASIHRKLIRCRGVIAEMGTFIEDPETGFPVPLPNCHDTRIQALAVTWYVADMETRNTEGGAVSSLRPCQILTTESTIKEQGVDVGDAIANARRYLEDKGFTFYGERQRQWWE
jgi:hypothetical protein